MAQTKTATVVVEELSKYGFKANGEYINYSKKFSESDKAKVVPGATFEAELFVSDGGKAYLNKILAGVIPVTQSAPVKTEKTVTVKHEFKPKKTDDSMSKEEWNQKDKRISRQGIIQVAVQVAGTFEDAVELANKMLKFVYTDNVNQD